MPLQQPPPPQPQPRAQIQIRPTKLKHAVRTLNIHQDVDIIPPKKMKKQATVEELQLVLEHFEMAHAKDIEAILLENEPHVIEYRDKMYAQAKKSGITAQSEDMIRLKVLGHVVQYAYMNIEPPNDYTKVCNILIYIICIQNIS